jgi:hypothetical protein
MTDSAFPFRFKPQTSSHKLRIRALDSNSEPAYNRLMKETADQLQLWVKVKRQCGLTDAQVQMARELGMKPQRLAGSADAGLGLRIDGLYQERFNRPGPDSVVPLRQLVHDARVTEKAERQERKRRKREAELAHAEAARVSLLTIRRIVYGKGTAEDDLASPGGPAYSDRR